MYASDCAGGSEPLPGRRGGAGVREPRAELLHDGGELRDGHVEPRAGGDVPGGAGALRGLPGGAAQRAGGDGGAARVPGDERLPR